MTDKRNPFPPAWIHRCQTPILRPPGLFIPQPVQPLQLRANPGVSKTMNLYNP